MPSSSWPTDRTSNHDGAGGAEASADESDITIGSSIPVGAEPVTIGRPTPPIVCGATPTTSSPSRSGAASSSACLIASSSVTADAEQSEQLPCRWIRRDALLQREQLDVAAVGLHVGTDRVERRLHPVLQRHRVQVMDQQQRRDQRVRRSATQRSARRGTRCEQRVEDPLEAASVHLDDGSHQLLGERAARASPRRASSAVCSS